jgi:hypothetical protein
VIFIVLAAVLVASQLSYAGVIDSYVTNLGNAEHTYDHDSYAGNWWTWDRNADNAYYWYINYHPGNGSETTWTFLQMALPSITGSITEATLFIDVTGSSSGDSALLYHTTNSSSASGDATQGLSGDVLVQTITDPANGWLGIDVTSFILNDYSNTYGWAAFQFAPVGGNGINSNFSFSIAEPGSTPGNPGNAPYLRITTSGDGTAGEVPEPGTLLPFGLGGTALLLRARAKNGA